jgi:hypothetical protein
MAVLLCMACATSFAAPADVPDEASIPALIGQLGKNRDADAATLKKLRPLIARFRIVGPDRSTLAELAEDAWFGTLETLWIDRQDRQGRIAAEFTQRILHSSGDALRVYASQSELESIADGVPVIVTGYRVGNRVLVTGVSQPSQASVP